MLKNLKHSLQGLSDVVKSDEYRNLPIELLVTNHNQDRKIFSEKKLEELALSISKIGIRVPLEVREVIPDECYEIIAGERRYRAAKIAKLDIVPVIVRKNNDENFLRETQFAENIHREDLNAVEKALAITRLMQIEGYSQRKIAEICGKSEPWVSKQLKILEQPEDVQELAKKGAVKDLNTLYEIGGLPKKERDEIGELIESGNFNYKSYKGNKKSVAKEKENFKLSSSDVKEIFKITGFDKKIEGKKGDWQESSDKEFKKIFTEFKKWIRT